jgi:hypothetical protein
VSHYDGFAICIKKYLKAKEKLWKLKYISPYLQKIYNLQKKKEKKPQKETKILQDFITL